MWLFTTVGFFSVTQVRYRPDSDLPEGTLQVRARVYEDLEVLKEKYLPEMSEVVHIPGRDYPYRGYVDKPSFSAALVQIVSDVTYSNFKDQVKKNQGYERSDLYMGVWSVMHKAEEKLEAKREKARRAKSVPMLPFERMATSQMRKEDKARARARDNTQKARSIAFPERDDDFERQLHDQLMEQEREREERIERMKWNNTVDRYSDDYDVNPPYQFVPAADLLEMEGMNVREAEELFKDFDDDLPPEYAHIWGENLDEFDFGEVDVDAPVEQPKKKRKRKRRRNRRRH